jgi:hypothetical protein
MTVAAVLKCTALGLVAFSIGFLLYPVGVQLWGVLLEYIAWPESRWGAEGSRLIGQGLQPLAYFLLVVGISASLAFTSARLAIRYSYVVSLGALSYFGVLAWFAQASVIAAAQSWVLEGCFFILLPPLLTMLLVRSGWLTRRSSLDRPQAAGPLS